MAAEHKNQSTINLDFVCLDFPFIKVGRSAFNRFFRLPTNNKKFASYEKYELYTKFQNLSKGIFSY